MKHLICRLGFLFLIQMANAAVKLPPIISDHMVLQQNVPVRIWGIASPSEKISISIQNQNVNTEADANGKWQAWLKPMKSARNVSMTVTASNTIVVTDILIGEVWLASGQSNMEWKVRQSVNADEEAKNATYPEIRFFTARKGISEAPLEEIGGKWEICSPLTAGNFSAVAYFFGRDLYKQIKTPVGLIETSWGATRCEAWTPKEVIEKDPRLKYLLDNWSNFVNNYPTTLKNYEAAITKWRQDSAQRKSNGQTVPPPPRPVDNIFNKRAPGSIYNGTIAPLKNYTIRGVIWYQGENNAYQNEAYPYRYLFPTMITAWRDAFAQGDFPFLFVQLSALGNHPYWPVLRESQLETLRLINTGMAVSIDLGDSTDAHYKRKQPVGNRLSLIARHLVYGENIEYSGPVYRQMTTEGSKIRLWFGHSKGLKTSDGNAPAGFTVAGKDGVFVPGNAMIDGETVVVSNPQISNPVAVRYAFIDFPRCNLVNGNNLPASSFRTDDFIIK